MAIYVPIVMYGLGLFVVVLYTRTTLFTKILECLYYSVHVFLSVHKVSSLNSVRFLRYVS